MYYLYIYVHEIWNNLHIRSYNRNQQKKIILTFVVSKDETTDMMNNKMSINAMLTS